jgi:metallo-beta-lactamase family protein
LAKRIEENLHLVVHIPKWRERLVLKAREVAFEKPSVAEPAPDITTIMSNTILDLEKELKALKKRLKSTKQREKIGEDDVDRLRYIQEELQGMLSE